MNKYEKHKIEHGKVYYNKKELALTQEAYLDGMEGENYYSALAIDEIGNEYVVKWEIKEEYFNNLDALEDESDACDWEKYKIKRL